MAKDFEKLPQETKLRSPEDEVRVIEVGPEQGLPDSEPIPAATRRLDVEKATSEHGVNSHSDATAKRSSLAEPADQSTELNETMPTPNLSTTPVAQQVEMERIRTTTEPAPFRPLTNKEKIHSLVLYITVPCTLMFAHYLALPGLWLLDNPMVRTILLGLFTWFLIGGAIYAQCRSSLAKLLCIVIFVMPMFIAGISVPVIGTFFHADFLKAFFHLSLKAGVQFPTEFLGRKLN